jgi:hypothetical protein
MDKWLERAIFLNIILLLIYLLIDYSTWNYIPHGLSLPWHSGRFENLEFASSYTIIDRSVWITGHYSSETSFEGFTETSTTPNFQLYFFILAIALNTYLVSRAEREQYSRKTIIT